MPTTVRSTDILFNDSTTQGTAFIGGRGQVFTSSGTFTVPTGVTAVKVTVIGGGGNGGAPTGGSSQGGGGGGAGRAIKYITGLTPGNAITVTVGAAGGTSSFGAFCSATGGAAGASPATTNSNGAGGAAGAGSGGDINLTGAAGAPAKGEGGAGGGTNGRPTESFTASGCVFIGGLGGAGMFGFGANARPTPSVSLEGPGNAATGHGNGGGGARKQNITQTGGAGSPGIVIVEY